MDSEQLITKVQVNLKEPQDLQKIYVDKKIKDKYYQIGDHVYLKEKYKMKLVDLGKVQ